MTVEVILDVLAKYGPGAIFAIMWWLERSERVASQANLMSLAERTIVLMTELKGLITGKMG